MPNPVAPRTVFCLINLFLLAALLAGCSQAAAVAPTATLAAAVTELPPAPAAEEAVQAAPTATAVRATPTQADRSLRLWISPIAPADLATRLDLPSGAQMTRDRAQANLWLEPLKGTYPGDVPGSATWTYVLASAFPTVIDSLEYEALLHIWRSGTPDNALLMTAHTQALLTEFLGPPGSQSVRVVEEPQLLEAAWKETGAMAVLPFDQLESRWKVLKIDGVSPLDRSTASHKYPLRFSFLLGGTDEALASFRELTGQEKISMPRNFDPQKLTIVAMTGVTAISRHLAERMESKGMTYPAQEIGPWLSGADITHISNEVSFYQDCPKPGPDRADMRFCSSPEYIALLEYVGTDIVELTGNHNLDWGPQPYLDTLEMYQARGWKVYGGGKNIQEAIQPLLVEHNGNRLAFLGCSPAGPKEVWAGQAAPGSAPCNWNQFEQQVRDLRSQGYLPVVTLQHVETDGYVPSPAQGSPDFRRLARAGAVVVSGSQSHYPQTMTFVGSSFVHYGLGNLFFDQMLPEAIRPAFIDRHYFYDGRYLGVELLTSKLEDYALQRPMTADEREAFLSIIFSLSRWSDE